MKGSFYSPVPRRSPVVLIMFRDHWTGVDIVLLAAAASFCFFFVFSFQLYLLYSLLFFVSLIFEAWLVTKRFGLLTPSEFVLVTFILAFFVYLLVWSNHDKYWNTSINHHYQINNEWYVKWIISICCKIT